MHQAERRAVRPGSAWPANHAWLCSTSKYTATRPSLEYSSSHQLGRHLVPLLLLALPVASGGLAVALPPRRLAFSALHSLLLLLLFPLWLPLLRPLPSFHHFLPSGSLQLLWRGLTLRMLRRKLRLQQLC